MIVNQLHIITLNVPYPPDYGGMIDSYYRIKTLHDLGVKIHLHSFDYGRGPSEELNRLCEIIHFYPRETDFWRQLSILPYVVTSRRSEQLIKNLAKDDFPILFDGLHTTFYIDHPALANRIKLVRAHNIEHKYYRTLAGFETNFLKKFYFLAEALRLKKYESILKKADAILTVSVKEQAYFSKRYGNSTFIPSFHSYKSVTTLSGTGTYVLYHGDLSIKENDRIAHFLVDEVFSKLSFSCIFAGRHPSRHLVKNISRHPNITMVENPSMNEMNELIANAHVHLLPVLKNNGLKLKLLLALYGGRHCVVNKAMVEGTYLQPCCCVADSYPEMVSEINQLMDQPFTSEMIETRRQLIEIHYDNQRNAQRIFDEIEKVVSRQLSE